MKNSGSWPHSKTQHKAPSFFLAYFENVARTVKILAEIIHFFHMRVFRSLAVMKKINDECPLTKYKSYQK
jgi:hypothetical protein